MATAGQFYRIRVRGQLGPEWSTWFAGLTITAAENGETTISGQIRDQAALYGVLTQVHDLGLPLLSVNVVDAEADHC